MNHTLHNIDSEIPDTPLHSTATTSPISIITVVLSAISNMCTELPRLTSSTLAPISIRTPLITQLGVTCEPCWGRSRGDPTVIAVTSTRKGPWTSYAAILTTVAIIKSIVAVITGAVAVAIPHPVRSTPFHDQRQ